VRERKFAIPLAPSPRQDPLPKALAIYDVDKDGKLDDTEVESLQIDALARRFVRTDGPPRRLLPGNSASGQLNAARYALMAPEQIVSAMALKPGQVVVDIGAGYGLFEGPLARAVGSDGAVFATDIDPSAVSSLAAQARELGLQNVVPVQVRPQGVDPFYHEHKFDVIFMCDSLKMISGIVAYLAELKGSLKPGGRLWVLLWKLDADFSPSEFKNLVSIRAALSASPYGDLVKQRLRAGTRTLLDDPQTPDSAVGLGLFIEDINRLLNDRLFHREIEASGATASASLNHAEKGIREFLARESDSGRDVEAQGPEDGYLRLLNRLILKDILGTRIWEDAFSLAQFNTSDWEFKAREVELDPHIPPRVESAGFTLIKQHDLVPSYRVFEFRSAD